MEKSPYSTYKKYIAYTKFEIALSSSFKTPIIIFYDHLSMIFAQNLYGLSLYF